MKRVEAGNFNGGEIWPAIAVEITDRKFRVWDRAARILRLRLTSTSAEVRAVGLGNLRDCEQTAEAEEEMYPPLPGPLPGADNYPWHH